MHETILNKIRKTVLITMLFASSARANDGDTTSTAPRFALPDRVISGTRLADVPFDQPYAFYRTPAIALDDAIGRTVLDQFNYGPGVFVQRTAPNQASPFVRGLTGEQTLLLLNGIRFNHAFMRPGPNQYSALIPGMSVSALDAILGSSSIVNGSDGLTGALDYRLAPAGRGITEKASPWMAARVDSGNGATAQLGVDGQDGDLAYSVEIQSSTFHDRVGGDDFRDRVFGPNKDAYSEIPNTAYDEIAAAVRLAYFGAEDHVLEVSAGHTRQLDAPRPGGYFENSGEPSRRYRYFDPQAFSYLHLRDTWALDSAVADSLRTTIWWHQFAEEQFRSSIRDGGTASERIRQREYDDTLDALGIDLQAGLVWGDNDQHAMSYGATLIHETTDNSYREFRSPAGSLDDAQASPYSPEDWSNQTSVSDGSDYDTIGVFAQNVWTLSDTVDLLTGVRFSHYEWSFGDVEGDASDVTGSARATWALAQHHRVFAGGSKGFRAPNLTNLDGAVDRGSSGEAASGNPNLEPEQSYTVEGGWKWQRGRDEVGLTVFKTTIDDFIQRDFSGSGEFTNVEDAEISGLESAWDYGVLGTGDGNTRVAIVGALSLVDATRDIPQPDGSVREDNISRANRLYGRVGLKVEPNANWWGLLQTRWHDDYDDVATDPSDADADDIRLTLAGNPDGSMPGYEIVDVVVGWKSDDGHRSVNVFVENIADETYREPGSGTDGVGRNVGVSTSLRF